jgi:hypothetical protein
MLGHFACGTTDRLPSIDFSVLELIPKNHHITARSLENYHFFFPKSQKTTTI